MRLLAKAVIAFNVLSEAENNDEMAAQLKIIKKYLSTQVERTHNDLNGLSHLNREMDIVESLEDAGL